jgi:hypothetical protein
VGISVACRILRVVLVRDAHGGRSQVSRNSEHFISANSFSLAYAQFAALAAYAILILHFQFMHSVADNSTVLHALTTGRVHARALIAAIHTHAQHLQHQEQLRSDYLASTLYRFMHDHGAQFGDDDWKIEPLATVNFPIETGLGAILENEAIQWFRRTYGPPARAARRLRDHSY